ncbi:Holliday junction resolvase RecU, partial [Bacillus thuringiensis]|uniref:Holliday junction resolvase RecU n=1 Tax=Bacillus thuringiensis TaxID=1428 RepID=UPI003BFA7537
MPQHQLDYLNKTQKIPPISFFLIQFTNDNSLFPLPLSLIQSYLTISHQPNRKNSIPTPHFHIYPYLLQHTQPPPLHYL